MDFYVIFTLFKEVLRASQTTIFTLFKGVLRALADQNDAFYTPRRPALVPLGPSPPVTGGPRAQRNRMWWEAGTPIFTLFKWTRDVCRSGLAAARVSLGSRRWYSVIS